MAALPPALPYAVLEPLLLDAVASLQHGLDVTRVDCRITEPKLKPERLVPA